MIFFFFSGLSPNTIYRVTVKAKNIRSPHFNLDETTQKYAEKYCTHVEFRTLPKGIIKDTYDTHATHGVSHDKPFFFRVFFHDFVALLPFLPPSDW